MQVQLSDLNDLIVFSIQVDSEEDVELATDEIEKIFELRNTLRRDVPNEDGDYFRSNEMLLRYPKPINSGEAVGTLGLRVQVGSVALAKFHQRIDADRRDAARIIKYEERRRVLQRHQLTRDYIPACLSSVSTNVPIP